MFKLFFIFFCAFLNLKSVIDETVIEDGKEVQSMFGKIKDCASEADVAAGVGFDFLFGLRGQTMLCGNGKTKGFRFFQLGVGISFYATEKSICFVDLAARIDGKLLFIGAFSFLRKVRGPIYFGVYLESVNLRRPTIGLRLLAQLWRADASLIALKA
jgi:hypothetical protein